MRRFYCSILVSYLSFYPTPVTRQASIAANAVGMYESDERSPVKIFHSVNVVPEQFKDSCDIQTLNEVWAGAVMNGPTPADRPNRWWNCFRYANVSPPESKGWHAFWQRASLTGGKLGVILTTYSGKPKLLPERTTQFLAGILAGSRGGGGGGIAASCMYFP